MVLNAKIFLFSLCFKEAKLAKFIRFEAVGKLMWDEVRGASISITKFTELWWNDGVFEGSEEHWKLWRCEVEIFCFLKRFFTMLCFVQNDRVLFFYSRLGIWIIFETQRFFIIPIFLRELSWRNSFALKRWGNWCDDVVMWWWDGSHGLKIWGIGFYAKTTVPIDNATLTDTIFFSPTLKGGKLFIVSCEFWFFLYAKIFLYPLCF